MDDPRNTDNAWVETCAFLFHDGDGTRFGSLPITAGDDATEVQWMPFSRQKGPMEPLHADHEKLVRLAYGRVSA